MFDGKVINADYLTLEADMPHTAPSTPTNRGDAMDQISYTGWLIVIIGMILGLLGISPAQAQETEYHLRGLERGDPSGFEMFFALVVILLAGAVLFSLIFTPKSSKEK